MRPSLFELQQDALQRTFVGRDREREVFASACADARAGVPRLLFVSGPPGIGKTTLLAWFEHAARHAGDDVRRLHGDEIGLSPAAARDALDTVFARSTSSGLSIVLLDAFERVGPLEDFVTGALLRRAVGSTVVVVASREPPSARVRALPIYGSAIRPMPLRVLSRDESVSLLQARGVERAAVASIVDFACGSPLALALAAEAAANDSLETEPNASAIEVLFRHFFERLPEAPQRAGLEACAVLRTADEAGIAALVGDGEAGRAFTWLRGLSFVDRTPSGLVLHDLVRELTVRDLRWRHPARHAELVKLAFAHLTERIVGERDTRRRVEAFADVSHLVREVPLARECLSVPPLPDAFIDVCDERALEQVCSLVARHEDAEQAARVAQWYERQRDAFTIVRGADGNVLAFVANLRLDTLSDDERRRDPAVEMTWRFARKELAGRPGGEVYFARHWLTPGGHGVDPLLPLMGVLKIQPLLRAEEVSFVFAAFHEPLFEAMHPVAGPIAGVRRMPDGVFEAAGKRFVIGYQDRRGIDAAQWLRGIAERALQSVLATGTAPAESTPVPGAVALERAAFASAVREALRSLHDRRRLARNPLVDARMVIARAPQARDAIARAEALHELICEAVAGMSGDLALARKALQATYVVETQAQEAAAESLGLAYGTFRRYLAKGIDELVEILWSLDGG